MSEDREVAVAVAVQMSEGQKEKEAGGEGMGSHMAMAMANEEKEEEEEEVVRKSRRIRVMMMMMRQLFCGLLLGQLLSFLITGTGVASSRLASMGVHAPATQSFCNYILLALVYGPLVVYHGKKLKGPWYHYMLLAIIDVEANYLAVKAYQYTTITSVLLLDRGSLLFVIFLAWLVFKTKCSLGQLGGVFTCIVGVGILLFSDSQLSNKEARKHTKMNMNIKGDLFVLTASFLYAICNILEEFLARNNDFLELVACLGAFGSIVSAIQLCVLELHEIRSISWDIYEVLPFLGYAVALFTFSSIVPIFLKMNGSTMLSLSLITSDMWATCTQNYVYHQKVPTLYFVSFGVVGIGMVIHSFFTWRSMPQDDIVESDRTTFETNVH